MLPTNLPKVSFILPSYNAEKYLDQCIQSIKDLDYPVEKIEIIAADGNSSDNTINILNKHGVTTIINKKKIAEYGKYEAFKISSGEFIVFIDADNIIASRDWLKALLEPLLNHSKVIGVESNYLIAKDFTSINTYANLLIIVDPLARMLSTNPYKIDNKNKYSIKKFSRGSTPIAGANGFIWRRKVLNDYIEGNTLEESTILQTLAAKSDIWIANVSGKGIYHYYCETLIDYFTKRQKIASKFIMRRERKPTWVDAQHPLKFIYSTIYLSTFIGPFIEATINFYKTRRICWFWHPYISFATVLIYVTYFTLARIGIPVSKYSQ